MVRKGIDLMFPCPCCGEKTLTEQNAWEICDVCGWEDDPLQHDEPDYDGGANSMSLNQAKEAYRQGKPID